MVVLGTAEWVLASYLTPSPIFLQALQAAVELLADIEQQVKDAMGLGSDKVATSIFDASVSHLQRVPPALLQALDVSDC